MPRSSNQKQKLAVLRSILLERTGEGHPMTMKEIIQALSAHGISAERKSIYSDIEALRLLGTDVKTVRGKSVGYYVASRDFELPELKLLVDAVSSSKFIPEKQSAVLIKKLAALASVHDRPSLNRAVFVSNRAKSVDENNLTTVDRIHEAMENNLDISFLYFSWTSKKKKEFRHNGNRYSVSPWSLVWDDSNYYLVGFDTERKEIRHYRVDKMVRVEVENVPRSGKEEYEKFDISSYSSAVFGMFGGKPRRVTLCCAKRLANTILDRFGSDTVILDDGETFRITVNVVPSPVFHGWVLSFGNEIKIISPQSVIDDFENLLKSFS